MKKILIRSGMSPLESIDPAVVLKKNLIGSNAGNLIYQYSIYRHLMVQDTKLIPTRYYHDYTDEEIDIINEEFDVFVIPLADAFRETFMPHLEVLTKTIKKLKIPCVVIGAGLRSSFEPKLNETFVFDELAKEFVTAVLKKSNIIGIRGEITAKYLSNLGFKEDRDYMVIGCPSMYTFGSDINIRNTVIDDDSKICINFSPGVRKKIQLYFQQQLMMSKKRFFIPQNLTDLDLLFRGKDIEATGKDRGYPYKADSEIHRANKARFFVNAKSWCKFLSDCDLSFGTRLHGNISALLAGSPAVLVAMDSRTRELASYHKIPSIPIKDFDYDLNIPTQAEMMDLSIDKKNHEKNFDRYLKFLKKNDLPNIFSENVDSILDQKIREKKFPSGVKSFNSVNIFAQGQRIRTYKKKSDGYDKKLLGYDGQPFKE